MSKENTNIELVFTLTNDGKSIDAGYKRDGKAIVFADVPFEIKYKFLMAVKQQLGLMAGLLLQEQGIDPKQYMKDGNEE